MKMLPGSGKTDAAAKSMLILFSGTHLTWGRYFLVFFEAFFRAAGGGLFSLSYLRPLYP